MRWNRLAACSIPLVLMVAVSVANKWRSDGPQSFNDVIAAAEERGLYWETDGAVEIRHTARVVVSTQPIDRGGIGSITARPGTVSCFYPVGSVGDNYDPAYSVFWGKVFVTGDPAVVEQLTGLRPAGARRAI